MALIEVVVCGYSYVLNKLIFNISKAVMQQFSPTVFHTLIYQYEFFFLIFFNRNEIRFILLCL